MIALQNTLFSAIVTAFIIEVYKTQLPSPGDGQNTVDGRAVRINRAASQLLPKHDERGWMCSHPAMV